MFKKMGEFITKRPWLIIALWVIILVVMAPFAATLSDHLEYSATSFMPKDTDSSKAQDIYDQQFSTGNKSQLIVAIESGDSTRTKAFITALNESVRSNSSLKKFNETASIYGMQRSALVNMTPDMHESLIDAQDNISDVNRKMYDGIDGIRNASDGLYGLWDGVLDLNNGFHSGVNQMRSASDQLFSSRDRMLGMSAELYRINDSVTDPAITNNTTVLQNYVIATYMATHGLNSSQDMMTAAAIYSLGKDPNPDVVGMMIVNMAAAGRSASEAQGVREIYAMGKNPSDDTLGTYIVHKAQEGQNDTVREFIQDAWDLGNPTKSDVDNYVLAKAGKDKNATERQTIREIWDMGRKPNDTLVVDFLLAQAAKNGSMNATQMDAAREIIALGRNATNASIRAYVVEEVMKNMNTTGNGSYFLAVMDLDRNMSNATLEEFGADWADTHDYDNPRLFPDSIAKNLISDNLTLFMVTIDADDIADQYLVADDVVVLRGIIADVKDRGGFTDIKAYVTGTGAMSADTREASTEDMGNIDKYTILLVLVLLLLYFRSILTPFVPLAAIGIAIAATLGAIGVVSQFISLYYIVMMFTVVIMLGAGVDYCVFLLSRYAEERREGADVKSAIITTVQHAGESIASSGLTAALGFGSLALTGSGMFMSMGIGVAIGLIISMAMTITLIPAVLMLVGDKLFWPNTIYNNKKSMSLTGIWGGIVKKVVRHAKLIVVLAILITVPTIVLSLQLQTGMDAVKMLPGNVESKVGFNLLQDSMGSGAMDRTMVTVTLPMYINDSSGNRSVEALDRIEAISSLVADVPNVDKVYSLTRPEGERINYTSLDEYKAMEKGYYETYMDNNTGRDNRTTLIYASFKGSPYSNEAFKAVDDMRTLLGNNSSGVLHGTEIHVGGTSAMNKDVLGSMVNGFVVVLPVVIIGIVAILLALLRSVLTPIRIVLTLGMSIVWTIAAFVVIFQFGMNSIMIFMIPIMLFISLMGMGVDYDIFLVTRIREEKLKGLSNEDAIVKAVDRTGTIITLCGAVMAGAFGTLMLSNQMMMQQIGFILFVAVAIDATVMRLVIVPAIMTLMGKYNWWMPGVREKSEVLAVVEPQQEQKSEK